MAAPVKTKKDQKLTFEGWLIIAEITNNQKKYSTIFTDWKAYILR